MAHQRDKVPGAVDQEKLASLVAMIDPRLSEMIRDSLSAALNAYVFACGGKLTDVVSLSVTTTPKSAPNEFLMVFHCEGVMPTFDNEQRGQFDQ